MPADRIRKAFTDCQKSADLQAQTPHHLISATRCGVQVAQCAAVIAIAEKALNILTVDQGTNSTAGNPSALTGPDVPVALQGQENTKRDKEGGLEKGR